MPIPLDTRKKPTDVKVHVSTGAGVDVVWSDGHTSHYDFPYLRDHCPCATCKDEREKKAAAPFQPTGITSSVLLPMYKPVAKARAAHPVGNYALQIDFTDGHTTGIYSFAYLREICPCDACKKEFQTVEASEDE